MRSFIQNLRCNRKNIEQYRLWINCNTARFITKLSPYNSIELIFWSLNWHMGGFIATCELCAYCCSQSSYLRINTFPAEGAWAINMISSHKWRAFSGAIGSPNAPTWNSQGFAAKRASLASRTSGIERKAKTKVEPSRSTWPWGRQPETKQKTIQNITDENFEWIFLALRARFDQFCGVWDQIVAHLQWRSPECQDQQFRCCFPRTAAISRLNFRRSPKYLWRGKEGRGTMSHYDRTVTEESLTVH